MTRNSEGLSFPKSRLVSAVLKSRAAADAKSYKAQASLNKLMAQNKGERKQTASLKGELTFNITTNPYNGTSNAEAGYETGTSLYDPMLVETSIRWFCPPRGIILDPFAGGSVRGIVSSIMGRHYVGIDLSARQIAANREQAEEICKHYQMPDWRIGDSLNIGELASDISADMILTCPPYGFLERYSDDPNDLSTMEYVDFIIYYREIIKKTLTLLKDNCFAVITVGDFRDKAGYLCNFPGDTVSAFLDAGVKLYNEMILETVAGSLPVRAGRVFASNRKIGKTHQNHYVFVKGDWKKASENCGEEFLNE